MKILKSKSGIAMVTLVAMLVMMAVLISTVTITGSNAIGSAKKNALAQELMLIQNAVNSYFMSNTTLPSDNQVTLDITGVNVPTREEQFAGEKLNGNNLTLYILDLKAIGIDSVTRGLGDKGEKDVYAISDTTKKVYYVAGEKIQGKTYYTLNNDLKGLVNLSNTQTNSNVTDGIIFSKDKDDYTNEGIITTVKIPSSYSITSVSATNGIQSIVDSANTTSGYTTYKINSTKANGNYVVTVAYTKSGANKNATFNIENFDNVAPTLTVGNQTYINDESNRKVIAYINDVIAVDDLSKVKVIKYESENIASADVANYFKSSGKILNSTMIQLIPRANYTIYVEDNAGNITTKYVTINAAVLDALKLY